MESVLCRGKTSSDRSGHLDTYSATREVVDMDQGNPLESLWYLWGCFSCQRRYLCLQVSSLCSTRSSCNTRSCCFSCFFSWAGKAAATAKKSGPHAGLDELWAKPAPPVKEFAYNQMRETLEREEQEHIAMANYGMATSARPPTAPWRMPQPAPPTPKAAPEAPKAAAVPEGSFVTNFGMATSLWGD